MNSHDVDDDQSFYETLDFSVLGEPVSRGDTDFEVVKELLGREPLGVFSVVVRDSVGRPRVIKNYPVLATGRPMPTLYWLVGEQDRLRVSRLESAGGVKTADVTLDAQDIAAAHTAYELERNNLIPDNYLGHRPSGGIGGTRRGVKCLHAHYAYYLAGGNDPVGRWVQDQLDSEVRVVE